MNIGSIYNAYYWYVWDKSYRGWNYELAIESHDKMIPSDRKYLSLWNDYYRLDNYKDAAQEFSKIKTYKWLYNAGNAFYKFWADSDSIDEKIDFWNRSLGFYTKSLKELKTKEAQENYDIVKSKLDELLKQKQEEKQQQTEQSKDPEQDDREEWDQSEWSSWEQVGNEDWSEESEDNPNQAASESSETDWWDQKDEIIPQPRWDEYSISEDSSVPDITEEEKASLERYTEQLKDIERQNQQFFNKSSDDSFSENRFDSFFNPFEKKIGN